MGVRGIEGTVRGGVGWGTSGGVGLGGGRAAWGNNRIPLGCGLHLTHNGETKYKNRGIQRNKNVSYCDIVYNIITVILVCIKERKIIE